MACKQNGYGIISIHIVVGPDGNPKAWSEPKMTRIEPKETSKEWFEELLALLSSV